MKKKYLNIFVLVFQFVFSVLLILYLIVPVYDLSPTQFWGEKVYSPYTDWKQSPLTQVVIKNGEIKIPSSSNSRLFPFKGIENFYVLDSLEPSTYTPFLLGYSIDDEQFLVKNNLDKIFVTKASLSEVGIAQSKIKGIDLLSIKEPRELHLLDRHLNLGHPISVMAGESDSLFCYNQLISDSKSNTEIYHSLQSGKNLILLSNSDLENSGIEQIPVIREIRWSDPELYLDLSEIGHIKVISSDYSLDTLSQSLKVKLPNVSWFRFQVDFGSEGFYYISNPFFRYSEVAFKKEFIKANNQLTIFSNLSWLIGIILFNLLVNTIRNRFL